MEVIYIDILFLLNLAADYFICLAAGRVCGVTLKRRRYLLAAVLGALYSAAVYLPALSFLSSPIAALLCGSLMCAIAYGGEARPLRCAAVFFSVSAAFGGALWALSLSGGGKGLPFSFRAFFLSFAMCYAVLSIVFHRRAGLMERKRSVVTVELRGKRAEFIALSDSGNSLCDPISGAEVMIVCPHALKPLFPAGYEVFTLPTAVEMLELADAVPELKGLLRLIPYSSIGGCGLLPVFAPERVSADGREIKGLLIAVSAQAAGDGFEAIL